MILVEWKGDDAQPFQLAFHPRLTVIHLSAFARAILVKQIASAFEAQLAALSVGDDIDVSKPLNVLGPDDTEWLLEQVLPPVVLPISGNGAPNNEEAAFAGNFDDGSAPSDVIDLGIQDDTSRLLAATHRELLARDAFLEAEADRDRLLNEAPRPDMDDPALSEAAAQLLRLRKVLATRIAELEQWTARSIVDPRPVEELLPTSHVDPYVELRDHWQARHAELRTLLEAQQQAQNAPRPPAWLIEQCRRELELATASLETFASIESQGEMGFLEQEARRRYTEALAMWEELESYTQDDDSYRQSAIHSIVVEVGALTESMPKDGEDALRRIEATFAQWTVPEPVEVRAAANDEDIRAALGAAGYFLPSRATVTAEATVWVQNRRREQALRVRQEAELSELRQDAERIDQTLMQWRVSMDDTAGKLDPSVTDAEKRVKDAQRAYSQAERYVVVVRRDTAEHERQRTTAISLVFERLKSVMDMLQGSVGDSIPLLVDAAFDKLDDASRDVLLAALVRLSSAHQVIYFSGSDALADWARSQDRSAVALCSLLPAL